MPNPTLVLGESIAANDEFVTFMFPQHDVNFLRLIARHVAADQSGPDALLTAHLSYDGVGFDEGPNYMNTGWSYWPAEPNPAFAQQPYPIGLPQTLNLGCRAGIDVSERDDLALDCNVDFTALGTLAGQPVSPKYLCSGAVGFVGGQAGVSPRPAHLGGGVWFPQDPQGTPFDWSAQFAFGGHVAAPGQKIRGIRFSMRGAGQTNRLIQQGYFRLEAVLEGAAPSFTAIGNFNGGSLLDGGISKPSTACAWRANAVDGWVGKIGSEPWAAPSFTVHGSSNDGFLLGAAGPLITAALYESNSAPTGPTDGTLVTTQSLADSNSGPSFTFPLDPSRQQLARWVVLSHGGAATSMYVAAVS